MSNKIKLYIGYALFSLASLYALTVEFFGIEVPDTFYYAQLYSTDGYIDFFRPLSVGLFRLVTAVFGQSVLAVRIACWLFYYGACVIAMCFALHIFNKHKPVVWWLSALSVALIPIYETTACNGNAMSCFFCVAVFITLYLAIEKNSLWFILLCIAISLAVLSRIPNVVIVPMVVIFGSLAIHTYIHTYIHTQHRQILYLLSSVIASFVLISVVYLVLYGSPNAIIEAYSNVMSVAQDTTAADHSIGFLLKEYLHTLKDFIWHFKSILLPILCLLTLSFASKFRLKNKWLKAVCISAFVLSMGYVLMRDFSWNESLGWDCSVVLMACISFICCILAAIAIYQHDRQLFAWALLPIFCSIPAAAGADSGLAYMSAPLFCLIPFICLTFYKKAQSFGRSEYYVACGFTLFMIVFAYMYMRSSLQMPAIISFFAVYAAIFWLGGRNDTVTSDTPKSEPAETATTNQIMIFLGVFIFLLTLSVCVYAKFLQQGDERPIAECRYAFSQPQLKGIRSNKQTVEWCNSVIADYNAYKKDGKTIVFYGYMSNMFSYLTHDGKIKGVDFTFKPNERNMHAFTEAVATRPIVFFIPLIPGSRPLYSINSYDIMYEYLLVRDYKCIDRNDYLIFLPNTVR